MSRYARQQVLSQFGGASQQTLSSAQVLVVGMGGLGSPVTTLLAGAGIGQLTIVDADVVSLSNLHRQTLYTEQDVGKTKVDVAKRRLSAINSEISIDAINDTLNISNAEELVTRHTVIVDAADSFLVTYLLSDLCLRHRIPLVSASVLKTQGYLGVFCGTEDSPTPSYRAIFPSPPANATNCDTAGVTGPSVGVIGSLQAQEVLKVVIADPTQLLGKVLYLDMWDYQQQIIDFSAAPEPTLSSGWLALTELRDADTVIDVRTEQECASDPTPVKSRNIPLSKLDKHVSEFEPEQSIVCICKSGQRALSAAHLLNTQGYHNVRVTSR